MGSGNTKWTEISISIGSGYCCFRSQWVDGPLPKIFVRHPRERMKRMLRTAKISSDTTVPDSAPGDEPC
jgi:hypothetical protein